MKRVLSDIELAKDLYSDRVRTVFIGDSNSLVVKTEVLVEVLHSLYSAFPHIERVTSYARAKTLVKKTVEDLARIRQAGLTRLHVGLETGDRELLEEIEKGATPEEMVEGGKRPRRPGLSIRSMSCSGIGGEDRWEQHAKGSAEVLNQIDPHFIRVRTLIPQPDSPLHDALSRGPTSN